MAEREWFVKRGHKIREYSGDKQFVSNFVTCFLLYCSYTIRIGI